MWNAGKYFEWATIIGKNHWRAPEYVNSVYDRSILTFITDLINQKYTDEKIIEAIETWGPLPEVIFLCDLSPELALERSDKRVEELQDQFDELASLKKYYELYQKAVEFVENKKIVRVIKLDSRKPVEELIKDVEINLK